MRTRGQRVGPVLLATALALCGCSGEESAGEPVATVLVTVVPEPAAPDPAPPDPAPPDPAPPDPAPPDPGAVHPDAGEPEQAAPVPASVTSSPMAVACADAVAALTDAVTAYETEALAEGGGGGDRAATAAEMRAAWDRAWAAVYRVGAGLPEAAAPAMAAVTALHDGLATRPTLDESDADPWRAAREDLQDWCQAQG
ncbi:hypothetical protein [Geodermatophilus sp. CPCC 205761]|uniref:hypothetical protein n=1 Tax=Geodermatophilus sp. CPCC 205761 TaxID=2936597 RepID=UPI003EEA28BC